LGRIQTPPAWSNRAVWTPTEASPIAVQVEWLVPQTRDFYLTTLLPATIYHLAHHAARGFCEATMHTHTLLDAIVAEGLALAYEEERVTGAQGYVLPHSRRATLDDIEPYWPAVQKSRDMLLPDVNWHHWHVIDPETKAVARVFRIGKAIVDEAKRRSGETAVTMARWSTEAVLAVAKVNGLQ
jgi:uncharacterized protein YjaZ